VAVLRPEMGLAPELVQDEKAALLFEAPHDLERWDVRARQDQLELESWVVQQPALAEGGEEGAEPASLGERCVVLSVTRGSRVSPMHSRFKLREGDVVSVAVYSEERESAHELLRKRGFEPQAEAGAA
jgi:hypothetical protein